MSEFKADAKDVLKAAFTGFVSYLLPAALLRGGKFGQAVLRSAGAFAIFTGSYRGLRGIMKELANGKGPTLLPPQFAAALERWSPAVAGALSAALGNAFDPSWGSSIFVIWLFIRAVRMYLPSYEQYPWAAPAVMVAAVEIIAPSGFCSPDENHSSYQRFLESFATDLGVNLELMRKPPAGQTIGDAVHRHSSDSAFMLHHVLPGIAVKSCKVYWPLHALAACLRLFTSGSMDFESLSENILRSTAFLTGWVGTLWWAVLAHSRLLGRGVERQHVATWAWLGGLWVLFERPTRQVELASYCLSHAVNSLYNRYRLMGLVKPVNAVSTTLLAASAAMLMNSFSQSPSFATRRLFGEDV